jgi:hypothetical protein
VVPKRQGQRTPSFGWLLYGFPVLGAESIVGFFDFDVFANVVLGFTED